MKQRNLNPIPYEEPQIPVKLDRYLRKVISVTTERWYIASIYEPTTWYRIFGGVSRPMVSANEQTAGRRSIAPLITEAERTINDGIESIRLTKWQWQSQEHWNLGKQSSENEITR